jgi:hypothetical protein
MDIQHSGLLDVSLYIPKLGGHLNMSFQGDAGTQRASERADTYHGWCHHSSGANANNAVPRIWVSEQHTTPAVDR